METEKELVHLTQYSHGAGCGCKISPAVLNKILHSTNTFQNPNLLVGNDSRDDAAVYDLGNGTSLVATTDFFMPIVDSPFDFGRIAATNAISDVYAMGGKPVLALAILGWPIGKLEPEVAQEVMEGARQVCTLAGISLAGGHSIDCPEPIFGLAVNGIVQNENLKRNSTAQENSRLYLTKALGVGILSTAQKKGVLTDEDAKKAVNSMTTLNNLGEKFGMMDEITAMTDVTGFGLFGHLLEMCEGSDVAAEIEFEKVPVIPGLQKYLVAGCIPGGTNRNWKSYGDNIEVQNETHRLILADPQTSGGLLVAVKAEHCEEFERFMENQHQKVVSFGTLRAYKGGKRIVVR